jgi:tRNA(adenine34) deaminase
MRRQAQSASARGPCGHVRQLQPGQCTGAGIGGLDEKTGHGVSHDTPFDDAHWMGQAIALAREAATKGEVPVGAVIVKEGQLIAMGCNAPIAGHDPTAHAEIVALREAARVLGNYRLDGCTLYVTLEPCAMCSGAMLHARLDRVVFGAADPRTGAAGSVLNLFAQTQLNHQTQVQGGVRAQECGQLLKDFFKPRRINPAPLREDALRTPDEAFSTWPVMPGTLHSASDWPELAGLRLCWHDAGPADAPHAQLFVHGPEEGALVWHKALAQTADARQRALAVDLIGFGRSDKPKKEVFHSLETHAAILHALCTRSGLTHVQWVAPPEMAPLLKALQARAPDLVEIAAIQSGDASVLPLLDSAYPDKGYRAGPRAWHQKSASAAKNSVS